MSARPTMPTERVKKLPYRKLELPKLQTVISLKLTTELATSVTLNQSCPNGAHSDQVPVTPRPGLPIPLNVYPKRHKHQPNLLGHSVFIEHFK